MTLAKILSHKFKNDNYKLIMNHQYIFEVFELELHLGHKEHKYTFAKESSLKARIKSLLKELEGLKLKIEKKGLELIRTIDKNLDKHDFYKIIYNIV